MAKGNNNETKGIYLDKFTDSDVRKWKKISELSEQYHVKLFYHLESLRSINHKRLCEALLTPKTLSVRSDNWWRIVDSRYANTPLSSKGSIKKGGRFNLGNDLESRNLKPFPVLYIAETENTARQEKFGIPKAANGLTDNELALRQLTSYAAFRIKVEINNAFDLNNLGNLVKFTKIISSFQLTGELIQLAKELRIKPPYLVNDARKLKQVLLSSDWTYYPVQHDIPANSQLFGRMLRDAGFDAVIYPSTKLNGSRNIGIFCENLEKSSSFVELQDPCSSTLQFPRLDSSSWKDLAR